jgi:hypothetical protein
MKTNAPTIFRIAGFNTEKSQWIPGLNNIFYWALTFFPLNTSSYPSQFFTLFCMFNLDRIGRRWTLYWSSMGQGIAMSLAGEMSRLAIDSSDVFNRPHNSELLPLPLPSSSHSFSAPRGSRFHDCTLLRTSHLRHERKAMLGVSWDGVLAMDDS